MGSAKSFQLKWAVDTIFMNSSPDREKLGQALHQVMDHRTVRGMFGGVHPDLQSLGVTEVKVGDKEVEFVGSEQSQELLMAINMSLEQEEEGEQQEEEDEMLERAIAMSLQ